MNPHTALDSDARACAKVKDEVRKRGKMLAPGGGARIAQEKLPFCGLPKRYITDSVFLDGNYKGEK